MIKKNNRICPKCGKSLKYYDTVKRIVKEGNSKRRIIYVHRFKCDKCGNIHRELPENIYPYKQYDSEIIDGVIKGYITSSTLGYDNYPCELTMLRWQKAYI